MSWLRGAARRALSSASAPCPPSAALSELVLAGQEAQPKAVVVVTGGGGNLVGRLLRTPGCSTLLLEAVVPYSKRSCVSFLARHARDGEGVGFCSEGMALRLAASARDRGLELEPRLQEWPNVHGVAVTATIISHYTRRGGYRVHAAAVAADGAATSYTHVLAKGHRDRADEDDACALLGLRALADAAGAPSAAALAEYGVRGDEAPRSNVLGETADAAEAPVETTRHAAGSEDGSADAYVLVPRDGGDARVAAPQGAVLPSDSILLWVEDAAAAPAAALLACEALAVLGRRGDVGKTGSWAAPPAPVFFASASPTAAAAALRACRVRPDNYCVLAQPSAAVFAETYRGSGATFAAGAETAGLGLAAGVAARSCYVLGAVPVPNSYDGRLVGLDDGSPSTAGVEGHYTGDVSADSEAPVPHGDGTMKWDNGVTYAGSWKGGVYDGRGAKTYSKGGGYAGDWVDGKRHGHGTSRYDGKFGYDRWEGPFADDKAHGAGTMFLEEGEPMAFEFKMGERSTKWEKPLRSLE